MRGADADGAARWERVEALYQATSELPVAERAAFLDSACRGDDTLRRELDELLAFSPAAEEFFARFGNVVRATTVDAIDVTDPIVGSSFGRYRVDARIGAGGMGVVYRAYDVQLQRDVVLKLMSHHLAADATARKRFLTEARAAAALDHPNICPIHETGETEDGAPYIAMAYCSGQSLKQRIARGRVDAAPAVRIAQQMARALAAAHARGIIHRDVKPANVMLADDGQVRLVDFGLAHLSDVTVTAPGMARGTFAYMAPELLRGEPATAQTDLWSLGVVLYEMVAGARPFRAESDAALLYHIVHERPAPITQADVPAELRDIINRLLHDDVEQRYHSARDVAADLDLLATSTPSAGAPLRINQPRVARSFARARPTRRWLLAVTGSIGMVLLLFLATRDRATPATPALPRVAVLFFNDDTPARNAGSLVSALTEGLTNALASVPALNVASVVAMQPFRNSTLSGGAIADSLDAEWMIGGRVNLIDGRIVVTAELIDETGRQLDSRRIDGAVDSEATLIEDVVLAVSVMVRERIGRELRLRRWQQSTNDPRARRLVEQAAQHVDEADSLADRSQPRAALSALHRADAALARAAEADTAWVEPHIERGWIARQLAATMFGTDVRVDSVASTIRHGLQHAERALQLGHDSARALEVRGVLRHTATILLTSMSPADSIRRWRDQAERELLLALESDNSLARALNSLSSIQYARGDFEQARITTERAYRADYFLQTEEILYRLFNTTFETGAADADAKKWCTMISRRYPQSWFVAECRLLLMTWSNEERADADTAWHLVERAAVNTELAIRRTTIPRLEMLAAGVVARAVSADSALRSMARTHARVAADTVLARSRSTRVALLHREASVRMRLGQRDVAIELIGQYLNDRPLERDRLYHSRIFQSLFNDPRLQTVAR